MNYFLIDSFKNVTFGRFQLYLLFLRAEGFVFWSAGSFCGVVFTSSHAEARAGFELFLRGHEEIDVSLRSRRLFQKFNGPWVLGVSEHPGRVVDPKVTQDDP